MASPSADVAAERPFYAHHAAAYDALVSDPVEPWVAAVDDSLRASAAPTPLPTWQTWVTRRFPDPSTPSSPGACSTTW